MATIVQMAFLLTPVVWKADVLPQRTAFVPLINPFPANPDQE